LRVPPHQSAPNDPFKNLGILDASKQALLKGALEEWRSALGPRWDQALAAKEIFWTNIWQLHPPTKAEEKFRFSPDLTAAMLAWCMSLLPEHYPDDDVRLDGFGFIVNPMGSRTQAWHIDYTRDYATVFIPLTPITPENATQYVVLSSDTSVASYVAATANLDKIDVDLLISSTPNITICQKLARPFTVLKMDFETIHRGIGNTGSFHRVNFWCSVSRAGSEPGPQEPTVQDFVQ
jgi:hypothetical protein